MSIEAMKGYIFIPSDTYLLLNIVVLISVSLNIILLIVTIYNLNHDSFGIEEKDVDGGE